MVLVEDMSVVSKFLLVRVLLQPGRQVANKNLTALGVLRPGVNIITDINVIVKSRTEAAVANLVVADPDRPVATSKAAATVRSDAIAHRLHRWHIAYAAYSSSKPFCSDFVALRNLNMAR